MTIKKQALAEQPAPQQEQKLEFVSPGGGYVPAIPRPLPPDWKLVPRKATPEMLRAMDECAQEGYGERLYAGMASSVYMAAWDASPVMGTLPAQQQEPVAWRELCRRLYVELYWCDRQMMGTLDEDGEPVWTQGQTVRDVLADAKAALETSPPASKPWVGLTSEDKVEILRANGEAAVLILTEAKLREKNA